ncbi:hypothetical protein BaRGS_00009411, partial [Batillaria attramentaria]
DPHSSIPDSKGTPIPTPRDVGFVLAERGLRAYDLDAGAVAVLLETPSQRLPPKTSRAKL